MVRDVAEGRVTLADPVAERRPPVSDRSGSNRGGPDLPLAVRGVAEGDVAGELPHLDRGQRRRDVARDPVPQGGLRRLRTPDHDLGARPEGRREEHQPLDVVQVQMRQEDVDARALLRERQAHAADAGARVEGEDGPVVQRDLYARGIAAVPRGLGARRGHRPARAPDLDLHSPAASASGQKNTMAPLVPSLARIGSALASIACSSPLCERIVKWAWAGRPWRRATVSGSASNGTCSPLSSNGPKAVPHSSGPMLPASSKLTPSSAAADSL